jgi:trk system potassium uptake protein TrkA
MYVIIVGGDKIAYFLARQLIESDNHVAIINRNVLDAKELARDTRAVVVLGDGTNAAILEEAGIHRADVVIALTPHDQDNLVSCQLAQRLYSVPRTVALVNDPDNEIVFKQLGVSVAFSATQIIASLIEQQTAFEDITRLMTLASGHVHVADLHLQSDSPAVGKSLQELNLTEDTLIACIIRQDQVIIPRGSNRLMANDHLLVISRPETQERDLRILTGED